MFPFVSNKMKLKKDNRKNKPKKMNIFFLPKKIENVKTIYKYDFLKMFTFRSKRQKQLCLHCLSKKKKLLLVNL